MKAFTVMDTSSGLVVSLRAVCTTCGEGDGERGVTTLPATEERVLQSL